MEPERELNTLGKLGRTSSWSSSLTVSEGPAPKMRGMIMLLNCAEETTPDWERPAPNAARWAELGGRSSERARNWTALKVSIFE